MKRLIIPIFVMNRGCPNRCVFCNERITAGAYPEFITKGYFKETVDAHLESAGKRFHETQIAFYGGSFTGMDTSYQETLLEYARPYIERGLVDSIRISTRPDYIDEEHLEFMQRRYVQTVEIGAQSLDNEVLERANRGHSADDVKRATLLLKKKGFETGLHLMVGLPVDTTGGFLDTVAEVVSLKPHMVRIHPTIVFRDTDLGKMYRDGSYVPLTMEEAVEWSKRALIRFRKASIQVIRLGLHTTGEMTDDGNIIAGPFHPSFRSFVEGALFLDMAASLLKRSKGLKHAVSFFVSPRDVSNMRGFRNINISILQKYYPDLDITVRENHGQERETLCLSIHGTEETYNTSFENLLY